MTDPAEPTERAAGPGGDPLAELAACRRALDELRAERQAAMAASVRRRDRMLDQIDRLEREVRRTRSDLRRARSWFGIRVARGIRRRLRAGVDRAIRSGVRSVDATREPYPAAPGAAAADAAGLFRRTMTSRLSGALPTRERPVRVAVVGSATGSHGAAESASEVQRVRDGIAALGLDVSVPDVARGAAGFDPTTEVVLLLDHSLGTTTWPRHLITVAWLGDRPDPWIALPRFDDLDLVLVADAATQVRVEAETAKSAWVAPDPATPPGAEAFRAALVDWVAAKHVAIHIPPMTWDAAATWGDTPFGRGVQRAFERRGWRATVHVFAERDSPPAVRADLSLHIFGLRAPAVRPGQPTILWIISHPDLVRRELCLAYDLIGVGSDAFLRYLVDWLGGASPPLLPLHQATDPDRFYPGSGAPAHELLFVGSSRDGRRPILEDLAGTPHDLAVYGRKWTDTALDPRHLQGDWIPNDRLHRYYSSAAIVLSDTWVDMRDEGFVPNRVYDVLAAGGFVISDDVAGIDTEFDGAVPVYRDRDELWRLIDRYLAHPEARASQSEAGRRAVLARHTFGHRVDAILEAIEAGAVGSAAHRAAGRPAIEPPATDTDGGQRRPATGPEGT